MRIGITGGAGFIGTNLARALINLEYEVSIIDDLSNGNLANLSNLNYKFVQGSITSHRDLDEFSRNLDYIVHLAARGSVPRSIEDPLTTHNINVDGTLNLLEVARNKKIPIIFSSSSSVYGQNTKLPKSEKDWLLPISPYAASKLACEGMFSGWANAYDMNVLVLRFFNVFGPFQRPDSPYAAVIPKWCLSIIKNKNVQVYGDGEQIRDFTYVDDVVNVIITAIQSKINSSSAINLAFGKKISLNEIIDLLRSINPDFEVNYLPSRPGDIRNSLSDGILIKEIFPKVTPTDFKYNLATTFNWIRSNF
jgi:UDP-glucose 4-epimerase